MIPAATGPRWSCGLAPVSQLRVAKLMQAIDPKPISDSQIRRFSGVTQTLINRNEHIDKRSAGQAEKMIPVNDGYLWYCGDVAYICNFKLLKRT
jgi:hypothetical protein